MVTLENNSFINDFLVAKTRELSKNTIIAYNNSLNQFVKWFNNSTDKSFKPSIVTSGDIDSYKQYLVSLDRKAKTINKQLAILSAFFSWSFDHNLVEFNPVSNVKNVKQEDTATQKWLNDAELKALKSVLIKENNKRNNLIISLILYAGLQVNELVELKISDIEQTESRMFLHLGNRKIPVRKALEGAIIGYLKEAEKTTGYLLLGSRGERLFARGVQYIVRDYGNMAGIKNLTAVTLRHTFGHKLGLVGTDPYTIAVLMGYTTADSIPNVISTLQYVDWNRYVKRIEKSLEVVIDSLVF
ncbi:MAG: tyrosine-type recombinase/integrase [Dehalobacterium sp.]